MPARASFDTLIKYLSYCTGSLYYISKKKNIQKKEEEEEKNWRKQTMLSGALYLC